MSGGEGFSPARLELYNEDPDSLLITSGTSGCYYNKSLFPKHRWTKNLISSLIKAGQKDYMGNAMPREFKIVT